MENTRKTDVSLKLSAEEACVIAGILNYPIIFGIEVDMADRWKRELPIRTKSVIKRLEQKKLLRVGLEGVVFINGFLRQAIDVICFPEKILMLTDHGKRYDIQSSYVIQKDKSYISIERIAEEYTLTLTDYFPRLKALGNDNSSEERISIELPLSAFQKINSYIENSDEDKAISLVQSVLQDNQRSELWLSLTQMPKISIAVFQNRARNLQKEKCFQFVRYNATLFQIETTKDKIQFSSIEATRAEEQIIRCF